MAQRKTASTKTSEEQGSQDTEATTQEDQGSQEPETYQEEPEQVDTSTKMVKVYNPQKYFYVQPSTQIKVKAGEITEVRDDNWAKLQIREGILQKAK